jgi:hypothetical protein
MRNAEAMPAMPSNFQPVPTSSVFLAAGWPMLPIDHILPISAYLVAASHLANEAIRRPHFVDNSAPSGTASNPASKEIPSWEHCALVC